MVQGAKCLSFKDNIKIYAFTGIHVKDLVIFFRKSFLSNNEFDDKPYTWNWII